MSITWNTRDPYSTTFSGTCSLPNGEDLDLTIRHLNSNPDSSSRKTWSWEIEKRILLTDGSFRIEEVSSGIANTAYEALEAVQGICSGKAKEQESLEQEMQSLEKLFFPEDPTNQ